MKYTKIALAIAVVAGAASHVSASGIDLSAPSNRGERVASSQRMFAAKSAEGSAERVFVPANIPLISLPTQVKAMSYSGKKPGGATQVGVTRVISETQEVAEFSKRLKWERAPDGSVVAAVAFESGAAKRLRLGLRVETLPDDARLRFYSAGKPAGDYLTGREVKLSIQQSLAAGADSPDARTFWAPTVGGDQAIMQIELPSGERPEDVELSVPTLAHFDGALGGAGGVGLCGGDAMCTHDMRPSLDDATVLLEYMDAGNVYSCTGTLLNPLSRGYKAPLILTAAHCIESNDVARTVQATWFYRSNACDSEALDNRGVTKSDGATLLARHVGSDMALLRLNSEPPAGALRAGWSAATPHFDDLLWTTTSHHALGDRLQSAVGIVGAFCGESGCSETVLSDSTTIANLVYGWENSAGPGSSGAALGAYPVDYIPPSRDDGVIIIPEEGPDPDTDILVIGQLSGGDRELACNAPDTGMPVYYGRFDLGYKESRAKRLLEPAAHESKTLDTNQDGKVDVVWSNPDTGLTYLWAMNGVGAASERFLFSTPQGWALEVTGDFNGDGYPDYLWRNKSSGLNWVYLMGANNAIIDQGALPAVGMDYVPYVIGDTGLDGRADIVWRNIKNGAVYLWQMNGKGQPTQTYLKTVGLEWEIAPNSASGLDVNGDLRSDIFWRNKSTGQNWFDAMSGGNILNSQAFYAVPDTNFKVVGFGDFFGDNSADDILWRNDVTGAVYLWQGTGVLAVGGPGVQLYREYYVGTVPSPWKVFKVGDLNADGKSDIFWMNPVTGQSWVYLMDGAKTLSQAASRSLGAASKGTWKMY